MASKSINTVGVIVARFQVPDLHAGHVFTINFVLERHQDVLIILGVSPALTDRNALSFEMRKGMIESQFPSNSQITIVGSDSVPSSYETRSRKIDDLIHHIYPGRKAIIYGSRDSFIHTYKGVFEIFEVPVVYGGSATEVRNSIVPLNSSDFRTGVIYAAVNKKTYGHPAVDVAVVNARKQVLLIEKPEDDGRLRFPGIFFRPDQDDSFETAAQRCMRKEIPGIYSRDPKIIGSCLIDDSRYRKTKEKVVSVLFRAVYTKGILEVGEGHYIGRWIPLENVKKMLIDSHIPLAALLKAHR